MVTTSNILRNTQVSRPTPSSWSSDSDEPPADYHRRVDRKVTGVIGNTTYPSPSDLDDVDPRDEVTLFARPPYFDSLALTSDGSC